MDLSLIVELEGSADTAPPSRAEITSTSLTKGTYAHMHAMRYIYRTNTEIIDIMSISSQKVINNNILNSAK
jgi:hypothetical protein